MHLEHRSKFTFNPTFYCSKGFNDQYAPDKQKKEHMMKRSLKSKGFILWRAGDQDSISIKFEYFLCTNAYFGLILALEETAGGRQNYYPLMDKYKQTSVFLSIYMMLKQK